MKRFLTLLFALALLVPWANAACYLIGPGAGGKWNYTSDAKGAELTETSSGIYEGDVYLDSSNESGWFTICKGWGSSWSDFNRNYRFKPNGTNQVTGNGTYYMQLGDGSFRCTASGTYHISVNLNNNSFTLSTPSTPVTTYSATIYFVRPSSWSNVPHIHTYSGADNNNKAMTQVSGNLYKYEVTNATALTFNVMFNNGGWSNGQTKDGQPYSLTITDGGSYYLTTSGNDGTVERIYSAAAAGAKKLYLLNTSSNTYTAFSYNSSTQKYYINTADIPASFYITDTNPVNASYGYWKAGSTSALNLNTDYTSSAVLYTGGNNFTFTRPTGATVTGIEVDASGVTQYIGSTKSGTIYSNGTLGVRINGTMSAAASTTIYYYQASGSTPNIAITHSNTDYSVASTAMTSLGNGWYRYTYNQATTGTYSLTIGGQTITGLSYSATSSYTLSTSPIAANNGKLVAYVPNGTANVASAVTVKLHKPSGWTNGYVSLQASGASAPYYQAALRDDSYAGWYTVTIPAASLPSSGVNINFTNGSTNLWGTWASAPTAAACYGKATTATLVADPSTYGFIIDNWGDGVSGGTTYNFAYDATNKVYNYDAASRNIIGTFNFGLMDESGNYHWGTIEQGTATAGTWYTASTVSGSRITNYFTASGKQFTSITLDASAVEKTTAGVYSGEIKVKFAATTAATYSATIYFIKPSSWTCENDENGAPHIHAFNGITIENQAMTQVDANLFKYEITNSTTNSATLIFNNGGWNGQSKDYPITITDGASYYLTCGGNNTAVEAITSTAAAVDKKFYLHDWGNVMGLGNFVQFQWDSTNSVYYIDVTGKTLPATFNVLPVGSNDYNYGYWQNEAITTVNTAVTLTRVTSGNNPASISLPRGATVTRLELDGSAVTQRIGTRSGTIYSTGDITVKAVGTLPTTKNVTVRFFRPIWNDEHDTDWSNTPYLAYSYDSAFGEGTDTSVAMTACTGDAYTSDKGTWWEATISGVLTTDNLYVRFHDGEGWDKYTVAGGQYEISGAPDVVCLTLETAKGDSGYYGVFADSNDKWKSAKIAEASCPDYAKWDKPLTIHFYRQRFPHNAEWTNTPVAVVYAGNYPYDLELTFNTTESSSYVAWYDVTIPANTIPATEFNVAMRNGANAADGQTSLWYVSEADAATMADICATMMQAASGKNHTLRKETCPGTTVEYYFWDAGKVIPNTNGNVYTDALGNQFVKFTQLSPHYFYIDIPAATDGLYHNYKITTGVGFHADNEAINDWGGCYDGIKAESEITLPNEWKKIRNVNGWTDNYDAMQYATGHIGIKRIFINDFNINDAEPRLWVSFEQQYPLYMYTWETNTQDHSSSQYEHVDVGAPNYVFTELTTEQKKFQFITDILVANNIPAGNSYQVAYGVIFPEPLEVKEDRIKQGEGFLVRYGGTDSDETNSFLQCDESSYIVSDQFEATGLQGVGGHTWHRDYGVLKGAYNAIFLVRDEQDPTQLFVIASSKGSAEEHQVDQDIEQRTATRDICLGASMTWTNPTNLDGLGIKGIFPCKQIYKIVKEDGSDLLTFDAIGTGTTDISSQLVSNIATYYGLPYNGRFYVELDFSIGIKAGKWFDFEVVTDIAKPVESINLSNSDVMCAKTTMGWTNNTMDEYQYVADFDWTMPSDAYIVNHYEVFAYDSDLYDSPEEAEADGALATCVVESNGVVHTGDIALTESDQVNTPYQNPLTVHSLKDSSKETVNLTYGVRPLYKVYFLEHPTTDEAAALAATYPSAGSRLRAASISSFDNVEAEPTTKTLALNNVVTGILGIDADRMPVRGIYNLQGQRVRETIPGQFYIINGKKTMVNSVIRDTDF